MGTTEMTKRITEASPRLMSRFVGVYYLLTIMTGTFVLFFHSRSAFAADLIATIFYLALTVVLYALSRAAARSSGVRD